MTYDKERALLLSYVTNVTRHDQYLFEPLRDLIIRLDISIHANSFYLLKNDKRVLFLKYFDEPKGWYYKLAAIDYDAIVSIYRGWRKHENMLNDIDIPDDLKIDYLFVLSELYEQK
jgi:hypothetical protein